MKILREFRILIPAAAAICFAGISAFCCGAEEQTEAPAEMPEIQLSVSGVFAQDAAAQVQMIYVDWAESWYLFLPVAADRSHLTITYETADDMPLILNETEIRSGAETGLLSTADTFSMQAGDTVLGTMQVMQSDIGCMYLTLADGGMEILENQRLSETQANALMLDAEGSVQYQGEIEKIKGRGNSSWNYADGKKPYNFKLPDKASLYGMGAAKKWSLLSNYLDHAMLRNEIAFAMSRNAGLPYTMDTVFVDLYLDGEYRGVYQLSERVQIHPARIAVTDLEDETQAVNEQPLKNDLLCVVGGTFEGEENGSYQYYDIPNDPADITGGYLIQFQIRNRSKRGEFVTNHGVICEICEPEYASKAQTEYIRQFVQELEDAIYSDTGCNSLGKHYSEYLDVDSFALGYLIQEITENTDSTSTSFYLYKDSDLNGDGKLHYGPVWDFDLAFQNYSIAVTGPDGNLRYSILPDSIFARYVPVSGYNPETAAETGIAGQSWLLRLWQDDAFVRRTALLYEQKMDAFLTELTEPSGGIAKMAEAIAPAAEMNRIRWHSFGGKPYKPLGPQNGDTYTECVAYIRKNLAERQQFLQKDFLAESIRCCQAELSTLTTDCLSAYDAPEQKQITALQKTQSGKLNAAESAEAAEKIMQETKQALAEIPRTLLCGDFDADGTVALEDAQAVLMYYTETLTEQTTFLSATQRRNGDVNADAVIDVTDAMHILLHYTAEISGLDYPLPVA